MAKVLLIEDDFVAASTVQDWLESQKHVVEVADCGEDGLHLLRSFGFDVAIVDWELPDINGVDVVRRFRQAGGVTPILMLTGRRELD
ncbi:MAG: response regulator, partial [Cyanobacteria bacterium]|nr:response regulator [Cyanobacteriota bacterium]